MSQASKPRPFAAYDKLRDALERDLLFFGVAVARVNDVEGEPTIQRLRPGSTEYADAVDELRLVPDQGFERFAGEHLAESEPPPALQTSANEGAPR